ncbi:MAG: DUF3137 domain-containing protein [Cyanobacteria bacterium P01_D01_bin.44]
MDMLRSILGPSKREIWSQIARDIGGEFIEGGFWGKDALVYGHGEWQILLDTYTVNHSSGSSTNSHAITYTRLRAPFVNKDGLYFEIYRRGFFSSISKFLGMQDIEIGDPFFDDQFIIKGNNSEKIRLLLADRRMKGLIEQQPRIHLEIKNNDGWFGAAFPAHVDQLYFRCEGIVRETSLLKSLFELFSLTLERLVQIDSAYEDDPNVELR